MVRSFESAHANYGARVFVAAILACAAACTNGSVGADGDGGEDADAASDSDANDDGGDAALEVGITCDPDEVVSPILTVLDAVTGLAICDATLLDAPNDTLLPCVTDEGCTASCQYTLAEFGSSATATFSVTVTAPGYLPSLVTEITPTQCGCEAGLCQEAQGVTASLVPADAGGPIDAGRDAGGDATVPDGATDAANDGFGDAPADAHVEAAHDGDLGGG